MSKMTVKEILRASAQALGLENAVAYIDGKSQDSTETDTLLHCFNLVENELALDYLPLYAETLLQTLTGIVKYELLPYAAVRVLSVRNFEDEAVEYKLFPAHIKTQPGNIKIAYTYAPSEKTLKDESDFFLQASVRLFVYGIAAECTLAEGQFEESAVWDKKYKDAITAAYHAQPCKVLRSRRWA